MRPAITIRSTVGRVGCLLLTLGGLVACVDEGWHHGPVAALRVAGPALLILTACWSLWGWPRMIVGNDDILVDNALRRIRVPWATLKQPRVHWGLVLDTDAGPVRVAAAPMKGGVAMSMGGGTASRMMLNGSKRGRLMLGAARQPRGPVQNQHDLAAVADRPLTLSLDASAAYALVTQRLLDIAETPALRLQVHGNGVILRSWRWPQVIMFAVGLLGTAWVLLG